MSTGNHANSFSFLPIFTYFHNIGSTCCCKSLKRKFRIKLSYACIILKIVGQLIISPISQHYYGTKPWQIVWQQQHKITTMIAVATFISNNIYLLF